ncbi:MAG: inositol monophosphatase family protein [Candidatus Thermoplasmatota archaeon]|nr:inositol monophosphatase family protein [Candidatus Thermoplasmatota archaeon]
MYDEELRAAREACLTSGKILLEGFYLADKGETKKGEIDVVTEYDLASEQNIIDILSSNFENDSILAEEAGSSVQQSRRKWIIDPLDGTTNFSHGYPVFSISIALEEDGEMVMGTVFSPKHGELFWAEKNQGAYLNGDMIIVSKRDKLIDSLTCTGFPYANDKVRDLNVTNTRRMLGNCMGVRRSGSAALDLCYVASGRLDIFWEISLKPWDTAAGILLVQEAGGKVTDFKGKAFSPYKGNVVATNGKVHEAALGLLGDE